MTTAPPDESRQPTALGGSHVPIPPAPPPAAVASAIKPQLPPSSPPVSAGSTAASWPEDALPNTPTVSAPPIREIPFVFTGNAREYFQIWIVNIALTIATLGIYSAWAKYRTKQYFHRHTQLDGSSFEYLADPWQLLKGRIIVAAALALLFGAQAFNPILYLVVLLVYVALSPFLIVNALRFKARNSAWRHVPFKFTGEVGEAYALYAKMIGWAVITCNLAAPYTQWLWSQFIVGKHRFGSEPLRWETEWKQYVELYIMLVPMFMVIYFIAVGVGIAATILGAAAGGGGDPGEAAGLIEAVTMGIVALMYAFMLIPGAYFKANVANLLFGGVRIGDHALQCEQRWTELLLIYVGNALALLFSLGLAYPWAKIRLAAYRTSKLTLLARGPLDVSRGDVDAHGNAIGDAAIDLGDLDLDLGF